MPINYKPPMALKLIGSGILRDGGSISADFQRDDGTLLSLLLEVCEIREPGKERQFGHLHVGSEIQNTCEPSTIVLKASEMEAMLLSDIQVWIESNEVGFDENAAAVVKDLIGYLPNRQG